MALFRVARLEDSDRFHSSFLIMFALSLMVGCASPPPAEELVSESPSLPAPTDARPPAALGEIPPVLEASITEEMSSTDKSLALARRILKGQGARRLDAGQREAVARAIVQAETEHGLTVIFSLAIMELESRFDPNAKGPAGSIGLMQLQPATGRALAKRHGYTWFGERTLRDPETNARLGLAYLVEMRDRFGSTDHAIAAYNIGPANLRRLLARRPLSRGPYLTKVYSHINSLRAEYLK